MPTKLLKSNTGKIYLKDIVTNKQKPIGLLSDITFFCDRVRHIHVMRNLQALGFNKDLLLIGAKRFVVSMNDGIEYSIDIKSILLFMELYDAIYDNKGEAQIMIPIVLFNTNHNDKLVIGTKPENFIHECNKLWHDRYKNSQQVECL